jgi:uncharacterized protein YbaP (TraB family)
MKTRNAVLAFVLILFSASLFAKEYKTGALLWKISGNGLTQPSYLLGTFHLKSGVFLDSIPGARAALESSEQVIGELNINNMIENQMQMMSKMMMPSDTTYHALYSEEDYNFVNEQLMSLLGTGLEQLGVVKPSVISTSISVVSFIKKIPDFNPENILDMYVQKIAVEKQKPILELETIDDQTYALFNSSSLQRQAEQLLCCLKNADQIVANEVEKLIRNYDAGDLNALYFDMMNNKENPCPSTPEEINVVLKARNDRWVQKLPALIREKSSFIAVGAGHLAGEEGLLNQLENAGYTIEAVK